MRTTALLLGLISAAWLAVGSDIANAQATRTWVSGVGDDANPCSRTAPCKTFAGAISKTAAGGEIDALDPGGFGALTITKAITIDGGGGQVASVLVAGTNGITVAAGVNDVVILRNIRINGLGQTAAPGINGISFNSGAVLHVENCFIFGFSNDAINIVPNQAAQVVISDTTVSNNGAGISVRAGSAGAVNASLQRVKMNQNTDFGLKADGSGGTGLVSVDISDSQAAATTLHGGIFAASGPGNVTVVITSSAMINNVADGVLADQGGGGITKVFVAYSILSGNNNAAEALNGAAITGYKTSVLEGNVTTNGTFTSTGGSLQ